MKSLPGFRPLTLSVLFSLAAAGAAFAQTADPAATISPASSPAVLASPTPGATVAASPAATATPEATPEKPKRTAEERKARKEERLRKYDTNKDGKLDKKERAAMRAAKGLPPITDDAAASPKP